MAFIAKDLSRIWHANGQTHYAYKTADAIATVIASGYFNAHTAELNQNDTIQVLASVGGTQTVDLILVSSASQAATVTTINGT